VKPHDHHHTDTDSVELTKKELLRLLADSRRRYLLHQLNQTKHPFELQTLARKTAAWEADTAPEAVSAEFIERVRMSLYHKHIPKLEAAGLVKFDKKSEMVTFDRTTAQLEVITEAVADGGFDDAHE
jgi:DNA-binding transcriptional ArsR family regulator